MGQSLDRGYSGEQDMGFYWGERGYFIIDGPSGSGGHKGNAPGFDGVAYNPTTRHLVIYDNKSFKADGNVSSATAIDQNFNKNIGSLITEVQAMQVPNKADILQGLTGAQAAATTGRNWPQNVQVAVSNAGGRASGVTGKLGGAGISFIDFNNAPPPVRPNNAGGGRGTTAKTGEPWMGPGGTPGFNPGRIQNVGAALEMFQNWAAQLSMISAAFEAWNAVLAREDEVIKIQNDDPSFPVYIGIYWKVINENNPNLYKMWKFFGVEIKGGGAGKPAAVYDADQKSYLMIVPARKAGGPERNAMPTRAPTWRDGFVSIYGVARGDHTTGGDPQKALTMLNVCAMYDILPILKEIRRADAQSYNMLEQALHWTTTSVGVDRLEAAFFAVRMSSNSGDPFVAYKAACKEFASLPADQQKDIESFLTGAASATQTALATPAGEWECAVGRFLWIYTFDDKGGVTWKDPFNGKNGRGTWRMGDTTMRIAWDGSKSWDIWTLPLNPERQGGSVSVDGEGLFSLRATNKKMLAAAKSP